MEYKGNGRFTNTRCRTVMGRGSMSTMIAPCMVPRRTAIIIAKYQARLRIAKMWDSIAVDPIQWDIKTITHPLA
jgi:hypothetical protein